jgi:hypothetical protein
VKVVVGFVEVVVPSASGRGDQFISIHLRRGVCKEKDDVCAVLLVA